MLINKDPVQASEKLYKAAEETVKALAIKLNLDEAGEAEEAKWMDGRLAPPHGGVS